MDTKLMVDIATGVMEEIGMMADFGERRTAHFCERLEAAFKEAAAGAPAFTATTEWQAPSEPIYAAQLGRGHAAGAPDLRSAILAMKAERQSFNNLCMYNAYASGFEDARDEAAALASAAPVEAVPELTHGHREDFYLMANARRISSQAMRRKPNWVFAMELFATGSTSAYQICKDAGIDPDGLNVERIMGGVK